MDLRERVILITGAGRRIGRAIALAISAKGASVAVHYNTSAQEAKQLVDEIQQKGGKAFSIQGNLQVVSDCKRIVDETVLQFKTIDILINNASVFFSTPFSEVNEDEWDRLIDTNLKGSFFCAQAAAKVMRKKEGKIINFADWSAIRPENDYLPYCISKAGIIALTKGLARTLAPHITVNAISPGPILPPEGSNDRDKARVIRNTPLGRFGTLEDIVNAILFLIEGTDFMTGATLTIDGGRLIA